MRRKRKRSVGGGGARNPNSLANLRVGPPAPHGNALARTHGAYARVARDRMEAKVAAVFDALSEDAPLREADGSLPASDAVVVRLLAENLARLESVAGYLAVHGVADDEKALRPAVEIEARLRQEALGHAEALGLSPRSRAKLGLDLTRAAGEAAPLYLAAQAVVTNPDLAAKAHELVEAVAAERDAQDSQRGFGTLDDS